MNPGSKEPGFFYLCPTGNWESLKTGVFRPFRMGTQGPFPVNVLPRGLPITRPRSTKMDLGFLFLEGPLGTKWNYDFGHNFSGYWLVKRNLSGWGQNMIRKLREGSYRLYSRKINSKTGKRRNLGTFKTLAAAKKHEREVQYFKRLKP